jgi:hypothetical protein
MPGCRVLAGDHTKIDFVVLAEETLSKMTNSHFG